MTSGSRRLAIAGALLIPLGAVVAAWKNDVGPVQAQVARLPFVPGGGTRTVVVLTARSPLSSLRELQSRIGYSDADVRDSDEDYRIEEESFDVWVPRSYRAGTPHGVVVWIDAGEAGAMPDDYGPVLARLGYLWVGARRSGNGRKVPVRINLALDAAHYMAEHYTLDPRRVVVAGLSGGGKSASRAALLYSEVFAGGVFVVGTDYWRPVPMSANGRSEWPSGFPAPGARHLARARGGRFVFVTGDRDMNRAHIEDVYAAYVADHFAGATLLVVPGMGHEMAPPERFAEALGAFSVQR